MKQKYSGKATNRAPDSAAFAIVWDAASRFFPDNGRTDHLDCRHAGRCGTGRGRNSHRKQIDSRIPGIIPNSFCAIVDKITIIGSENQFHNKDRYTMPRETYSVQQARIEKEIDKLRKKAEARCK